MADFIGSMIFLDGKVRRVEGSHAVIDIGLGEGFQVLLRKPGVVQGRPVTVEIRPERNQLRWQKPADMANSIAGRVSSDSYLGDRGHCFIEIPWLSHRVAVALQNTEPRAAASDSRARDVWLTWNAESTVLLARDERQAELRGPGCVPPFRVIAAVVALGIERTFGE